MRITIVPGDGFVIVEGIAYNVDCSSIDPGIHAVQWQDDHGEIEFKSVDGVRPLNERIENMQAFQTVLELWNAEHSKPPPAPPKANRSMLDDFDMGATIAEKLSTPKGA